MMEPKLFVATKAFIVHQGRILVVRESHQYVDGANIGLFDVVGGRLEPGQRFDKSLLREIREETGLTVQIGRPFYVGEWRPVVRGEIWQIVGTYFECFTDSDQVVLSADHSEYRWIQPADYSSLPIIENLTAAFASYLSWKQAD